MPVPRDATHPPIRHSDQILSGRRVKPLVSRERPAGLRNQEGVPQGRQPRLERAGRAEQGDTGEAHDGGSTAKGIE